MTTPKPLIKCTFKELKAIILTADRQIAEWKKARGRADKEIIRRNTQSTKKIPIGDVHVKGNPKYGHAILIK